MKQVRARKKGPAGQNSTFTDDFGRLWEDNSRRRLLLPSVEVRSVSHCNLACVACSPGSPAARPSHADPATVCRDLRDLSTALACREVRVTGGEPLLHPDLEGLLRAIKRSGAAPFTEVNTNGLLLAGRRWGWTRFADRVQVSLYPGREPDMALLREFADHCLRGGGDVNVRRYPYFRSCQPARPLSAADTAAVFDTCQDAHATSCHIAERGSLYLCLPSLFIGAGPADRCAIRPLEGLAGRLASFLYRRRPLKACRNCLGTAGDRVPHRQAPPGEWKKLSYTGRLDRRLLARLRKDPWMDSDCYEDVIPWSRRAPGDPHYNANWKKILSARAPGAGKRAGG